MALDSKPDPTTEATIAVVHRFNAAFNRQDVDAIMALMTPDCRFENTFPPPDGARYTGTAAVRGFWEAMFGSAAETRFDWEELFACGDRAVVRWTYHWTGAGEQSGHVRGVKSSKNIY
jgi:ketosteroid isomerase-like protein